MRLNNLNKPTAQAEIKPVVESETLHITSPSLVSIVVTQDRFNGVLQAIENLGEFSFQDEHVFIKPNFNSADPAPGSTHTDVLRALVMHIYEKGASKITVGDRSGMGNTQKIMEELNTYSLAQELGFEVLVFDDLPAEEWEYVLPQDSHWKKGFAIPKILRRADSIVQTCCLKTHKFGGHFTISLKNSVGFVAKKVPGERHDYMRELHTSRHQRQMIAEINTSYIPDLIVLDAVSAFTTGGPAKGKLVAPNVIVAGIDRIAIDAIGVAILRMYSTTKKVSKGSIFEQAQIARAVELGLGISSSDEIEFITYDEASSEFSKELRHMLNR